MGSGMNDEGMKAGSCQGSGLRPSPEKQHTSPLDCSAGDPDSLPGGGAAQELGLTADAGPPIPGHADGRWGTATGQAEMVLGPFRTPHQCSPPQTRKG